MCEYCEGGKPIRENPLVSVVGGIIFMRVKRNKWGPCLSIGVRQRIGSSVKYLKIMYCPMCGRKLAEEK